MMMLWRDSLPCWNSETLPNWHSLHLSLSWRVERHVLLSYANESTLCRTLKVQYDVDDDEAVAFWHCHAVKRNQTPIRAIKMKMEMKMKIGCEVATQQTQMQQWVAFGVGQHLCAVLPQNVLSVCRSVRLTLDVFVWHWTNGLHCEK